MQCGDELQELVNNSADKQPGNASDASSQSEGSEGPRWKSKQAVEYDAGILIYQVASKLM